MLYCRRKKNKQKFQGVPSQCQKRLSDQFGLDWKNDAQFLFIYLTLRSDKNPTSHVDPQISLKAR